MSEFSNNKERQDLPATAEDIRMTSEAIDTALETTRAVESIDTATRFMLGNLDFTVQARKFFMGTGEASTEDDFCSIDITKQKINAPAGSPTTETLSIFAPTPSNDSWLVSLESEDSEPLGNQRAAKVLGMVTTALVLRHIELYTKTPDRYTPVDHELIEHNARYHRMLDTVLNSGMGSVVKAVSEGEGSELFSELTTMDSFNQSTPAITGRFRELLGQSMHIPYNITTERETATDDSLLFPGIPKRTQGDQPAIGCSSTRVCEVDVYGTQAVEERRDITVRHTFTGSTTSGEDAMVTTLKTLYLPSSGTPNIVTRSMRSSLDADNAFSGPDQVSEREKRAATTADTRHYTELLERAAKAA